MLLTNLQTFRQGTVTSLALARKSKRQFGEKREARLEESPTLTSTGTRV